eukprot:s7_g92.t1
MEAAGRFLQLLRKPVLADRPAGDKDDDPIPEEWELEMSPAEEQVSGEPAMADEDMEEEEWRKSTAAMEVRSDAAQPDAPEQPDAELPDEQPDATPDAMEEHPGEEEQEVHEEVEEEVPAADDAELDDHADDDDNENSMNKTEYEEMDKGMKDLKQFVEDEHKKKASVDEGHGDGDHDQSSKYRNKDNKGKGGYRKRKELVEEATEESKLAVDADLRRTWFDAQRSDEELLWIIQKSAKGAEQATSPFRIAEDGVLERFAEKDGLKGEIWVLVVPDGKAGELMTWKEFCFWQVHTGILGAHT